MTDFALWKVPVGYVPLIVSAQQEALILKMREVTNAVIVNLDDVPDDVRRAALDALALYQETQG